jgi:hypothetical protein
MKSRRARQEAALADLSRKMHGLETDRAWPGRDYIRVDREGPRRWVPGPAFAEWRRLDYEVQRLRARMARERG